MKLWGAGEEFASISEVGPEITVELVGLTARQEAGREV